MMTPCIRIPFYLRYCFSQNTRVDQIVGKGPKGEGETVEDQSMMGRLVKVEKQVRESLEL